MPTPTPATTQGPTWDADATPVLPVTPAPSNHVLDAALRYVRRGWPLIDGVYGLGPRDPGWPSRPPITTEAQARGAFGGELRQLSLWTSHFVDLDLDCEEAVQLAPSYLPTTASVWGRTGNPRSHYLYQVEGSTRVLKLSDADQRVLLEVRGRGPNAISALPPSAHPKSGELYCWHEDGEPARVAWDDLVTAAKTLAAAALLLRAWPEVGGRNEFAKHVAGMLAHAEWTEERVVRFLRPIIEAAHDDVEERLRDAVVHTVRQHQRGQSVTGTPTLAALLGPAAVDRAREWLGVGRGPAVTGPSDLREPGLVFERASDLLASPDTVQRWVVEHQLPIGGLGLLVGYPKSGKSVTAQHLALAVARGASFLGRFPTTPGAVFYIAHEEHRDQTRRRWREMGASSEPVYFAFAPHLEGGLAKLRVAVSRAPEVPALVIIDPLFKFVHVKDVNDYAQVTAALAPLMAFTRETGLAILALHHTGKGSREVGQEALGSTGIIGGVDMMWVQRRHSTEAGDELYRTLRCSEQRYGHTFPELVLALDPTTCTLSVAGTRAETEQASVAARILTALDRRPDGMLREEIEEVAGVRTALVRGLLKGMVERGEVRPVVGPGSARAKRYFRGSYTLLRPGCVPASHEGEQATVGRTQDSTQLGCSLYSVPTGNKRTEGFFPLVRTDSPLVPAVVPAREQASPAGSTGTSEHLPQVQAAIDLFDGEIVPALVKRGETHAA